MSNEKKSTFNPVEALQEVIRETTQVTQSLRGLKQEIIDEKEGVKKERLKFFEEFKDKTSKLFKENEQIANRAADNLKKSISESIQMQVDEVTKQLKNYANENERFRNQLKEFSYRKNILLYSLMFSILVFLVSVSSAIIFYKYGVQSKQEILTEYQEQLEQENKVIVNKSTQVEIGYVNEWIEENPKEGQRLIDYVSKRRTEKE